MYMQERTETILLSYGHSNMELKALFAGAELQAFSLVELNAEARFEFEANNQYIDCSTVINSTAPNPNDPTSESGVRLLDGKLSTLLILQHHMQNQASPFVTHNNNRTRYKQYLTH